MDELAQCYNVLTQLDLTNTIDHRPDCFFNESATTEIYTLSLHDALPLIEERLRDENGFLLRRGDGQAIARAGVNFNQLARDFILLGENQPREVSRVLEFGDDHAIHGNVEALENALDQVVRERAFLGLVPQEHADHCPHLRLDVDDEHLFVIANKQCAAAVGGKDAANLHGQHIVLHVVSLCGNSKKTSGGSQLRISSLRKSPPPERL